MDLCSAEYGKSASEEAKFENTAFKFSMFDRHINSLIVA